MFLGMFGRLGEFTYKDGKCHPDGDLLHYAKEFIADYYSLEIPANQDMTPAQLIEDIAMQFKNLYGGRYVSFLPSGCPELDFVVKSRLPGSYQHTAPAYFGAPEACGTAGTAARDSYGPIQVRAKPQIWDAPSEAQPVAAPARPATFIDAAGKVRADSELESYSRWYLDTYYNLRPVGSETVYQLKDRIMNVFLSYQGVTASGATFDSEIGPVTMDEVIASESPLSTAKPRTVSQTTKTEIAAKGPVKALTTPGPGKQAGWFNLDELMKLFASGAKGYSGYQQQVAAAQLMNVQQQGKPLYVDPQTASVLKQKGPSDWTYATIALAVTGLAAFLFLRD
jgi:hypothetical protein